MLRYLLEKEFKQILRHRFLPRVILFMPLMMLGILPFAANQEVKEVRVAILDNDHSMTSRRLIEKVKGSGYSSSLYQRATKRHSKGWRQGRPTSY